MTMEQLNLSILGKAGLKPRLRCIRSISFLRNQASTATFLSTNPSLTSVANRDLIIQQPRNGGTLKEHVLHIASLLYPDTFMPYSRKCKYFYTERGTTAYVSGLLLKDTWLHSALKESAPFEKEFGNVSINILQYFLGILQ